MQIDRHNTPMLSSWLDSIANHPLRPWLAALWGLYLLILALWIIKQKHEPVATMSWLLGLAALPLIGFLIYHFLGPQRIRRRRHRKLRARLRLQRALPTAGNNDPDAGIERLIQATTGFPPVSATDVKLLSGGEATFTALFDAIAQAKDHIHLEYYIYEPDGVGTRLRDALVERARHGVKIRLLLDGIGAARCSPAFLKPLKDCGAQIGWFHPLHLIRLLKPTLNLRTHRKIVIVDGQIGFTGGVNIADSQASLSSGDAFHDLHMRFEGEIVRSLQLAFVEQWNYAVGEVISDQSLWPNQPAGPIRCQLLPSGPDSIWEPIHRAYLEAIHQAQRRVWLMTPYFVPGQAALQSLTSAALRGLDVRVLMPRRCDSRLVKAAGRSFYRELLHAGVQVFEYQPRMLHGKALLLDDDLCFIGSANFDHRSFGLNFELAIGFRDSGVAGGLAKRIEADLTASHAYSRSWKPGWWADLGQSLARLLAPLL